MNQIITLTLAPAVDVEYHSAGSQPGLNRTYSHTVTAGGKGINVSRAILRLSDENETPRVYLHRANMLMPLLRLMLNRATELFTGATAKVNHIHHTPPRA